MYQCIETLIPGYFLSKIGNNVLEYTLRHFLSLNIMGAKDKMLDELDHNDRIDVQTGKQRQTCLSDGHGQTDIHT